MSDLTEAERAYFLDVRKERDALWTWLNGQPQQVSAVIAVRAGLRVLPFVVGEPVEGRYAPKEARAIVSSFRYIALGRLRMRRPGAALGAMATLLNSISDAKGSSATGAIREASRATLSRSPPASSADAARDAASRAAQAVLFCATSPAGAPWDAIAADRAWIEAGRDLSVLLDQPMWLHPGSTGGLPEPHASRWEAMRAALDGEDESWRVWTVWYQDRLRGASTPADAADYLRLTLVPDAMARAEDPAPDSLKRWTADIEANRDLLKGSPRKANRVATMLIDQLGNTGL